MSNTKIETDEAALAVAEEIASLANAITRKEAAAEQRLQAVRDEVNVELDPMRARLGERTKAFCAYLKRKGVTDRLFKEGQKQGESNKAIFGFRNGALALSPLDSNSTLEAVAQRLLSEGHTEYIILPKSTPELNKAAILAAKLSPEALAKLGLRSAVRQRFYCELKDAIVTEKTTCTVSKS